MLTVLICVANPVISYYFVTYFGLESNSIEYVFFDDPSLANYTSAIIIEGATIGLLKKVDIGVTTSWLIMILALLMVCHACAFFVIAINSTIADYMVKSILYELVAGPYHAIITILLSSQAFILIVRNGEWGKE